MKSYFLMVACSAILFFLGENPSFASSDTEGSVSDTTSLRDGLNSTQDRAGKEGKVKSISKLNIDSQGVILKGYDPVAYYKQGKPVKGDPGIESVYEGATYRFASSSDKADFDRDPARYAPQYGAFCAYGIANGVLFDPEGPGSFTLYRGKLYVCGNQGALKSFKNNIESNIAKGDLNWLSLSRP
ncbi:MAG: hypothetical protein JO076_17355 [Verrucomicrobia bacterium]|nr:hypothetical protein [Verrucomicrobiota bacterium]